MVDTEFGTIVAYCRRIVEISYAEAGIQLTKEELAAKTVSATIELMSLATKKQTSGVDWSKFMPKGPETNL